jgi:hypothetical protein
MAKQQHPFEDFQGIPLDNPYSSAPPPAPAPHIPPHLTHSFHKAVQNDARSAMSNEADRGYSLGRERIRDDRRKKAGLEFERKYLMANDYNQVKLRYFRYQYNAARELALTCEDILHNERVTPEQRRKLNEQYRIALRLIPKWKAKLDKQEKKWYSGKIVYNVLPYDPYWWDFLYQPGYDPDEKPKGHFSFAPSSPLPSKRKSPARTAPLRPPSPTADDDFEAQDRIREVMRQDQEFLDDERAQQEHDLSLLAAAEEMSKDITKHTQQLRGVTPLPPPMPWTDEEWKDFKKFGY